MAPRASQNKKGSGQGAGCLIWIAIFLFIALLFLLNRNKIEETLKNTDFMDLVKTRLASPTPASRTPGASSRPAISARPAASPVRAPSSAPTQEVELQDSPRPRESQAPARSPSPRPSAKASSPTPAPSKRPSPAPSAAASPAPKFRNALLYFVRIDDDGTVIRYETKRSIPTSDSPLTDSLNALLKGPSADDLAKGYMSLIPQGTKLLSVVMRGSTAEANFNEAFMFNKYGIEGYVGQLKQVVWTATAFPTVQDVQIKIEGRIVDYLGSEGVFIRLPLSRNSF